MSSRTLARISLSLALVSGALATPAAAQTRRDRDRRDGGAQAAEQLPVADLILFTGRSIPGVEVREEKFAAIKYKERGARSTSEIPGEQVREIRYQEAPAGFSSGVSQLRAGLYERAAESFASARDGAAEGSWVRLHATFWAGECKRLAGKHTDAIAEYNRLLEQAPDHFLAPAAIHGLGSAQAASGSDGVATFARLNEGWGDMWRLKGKLGEGDAFLAKGEANKARTAYTLAKDGALRYPAVRRAAEVGIGKCLVADKRFDDAVNFFREIVGQPGIEAEVGGGAWVGVGDCRWEQAHEQNRSSPDRDRLKEALIAYQTCVVRYAGTPSYARALFMSSRIYRLLGLEAQAGHMAEELKARCPSSPYVGQLGQ